MRLSVFNTKLLTFCISIILVVLFCKIPIQNQYIYNESTTCNVFTMSGFGTGSFINSTKYPYILTCKHVVGPTDTSGPVSAGNPKNNSAFPAKLVVYSKTLDFSILEIDAIPTENKIAKYESVTSTIYGDKIYYFGLIARPGLTFLHEGVISQKNVSVTSGGFYDAGYFNLLQGSSGSTIFNKSGLGVGIVCLGNRMPNANHCLYLKIDDIRKSLGSLSTLDGILDGNCQVKLSKMHNGPIELP